MFTAPEVGGWLSDCEDAGLTTGGPDAGDLRQRARLAAALRARHDAFRRNVGRGVRTRQDSRQRRVGESRANGRTSRVFAPHLETVFGLTRRLADLWGYEASPYDALLEGFEPGAREAELAALFDGAAPRRWPGCSARRRSVRRGCRRTLLAGHYPVASQQAFNREVAGAIGFDFEAGEISTTTHPFCNGLAPGDCRLTTRYDEGNFLVSLYGVLHEAGHGMYEQGLPPAALRHPGGHGGLARHPRIAEPTLGEPGRAGGGSSGRIGCPRAVHHFPHLAGRTPEEMFAAVNRVRPSFIRVEADQVTYDLHIILRFGLERRILKGELAIKDVPAAWNEEFETSFGLPVPNDAHGCLQDIHWSEGLIGYFPTYTLGNLYAAQLFRRAQADLASLSSELAAGQYAGLLGWLRENVHQQGERFLPGELIQKATGEPLRADYYLTSLREKFAG